MKCCAVHTNGRIKGAFTGIIALREPACQRVKRAQGRSSCGRLSGPLGARVKMRRLGPPLPLVLRYRVFPGDYTGHAALETVEGAPPAERGVVKINAQGRRADCFHARPACFDTFSRSDAPHYATACRAIDRHSPIGGEGISNGMREPSVSRDRTIGVVYFCVGPSSPV